MSVTAKNALPELGCDQAPKSELQLDTAVTSAPVFIATTDKIGFGAMLRAMG